MTAGKGLLLGVSEFQILSQVSAQAGFRLARNRSTLTVRSGRDLSGGDVAATDCAKEGSIRRWTASTAPSTTDRISSAQSELSSVSEFKAFAY